MFKEGNNIKVGLAQIARTQVWLVGKLRERGTVTDKTELSSVLAGTRKGPKADTILQLSEEIIREQLHNADTAPEYRKRAVQNSAKVSEH